MRILRRVGIWTAAGGLMLVLGTAAWGQATGRGTGTGRTALGQHAGGRRIGERALELERPDAGAIHARQPPDPTISPRPEEAQAKMRNIDRQKQLVEDTQKLLALANELKADVDKSTKDTISLDVIKKADEIEKLAHSVKEKMKNAS